MKKFKVLAGFKPIEMRDKCFEVNHINHSSTDATRLREDYLTFFLSDA
jgi:hypothetical protein